MLNVKPNLCPSGVTGEENTMTTKTAQFTATRSNAMAFVLVTLVGVALLTVSGMAQATVLHDAAHDQRHAMAFPCH